MLKIKNLIILYIAVLATGCTTLQLPVDLDANNLISEEIKVGIVQTEMPKSETHYTGNIGLLDYAIISGVNSSLDKHLKSLTFEEYEQLSASIAEKLNGKGIKTEIITDKMPLKAAENLKMPSEGMSKNDFSKYKVDNNVSHILLIKLNSIGTTRSYYGPVPTSEPLAQTSITGQLVNITTNKLEWYYNSIGGQVIESPWDESDSKYPNLTTAVYQSLDKAMKQIILDLDKEKAASNKVTK